MTDTILEGLVHDPDNQKGLPETRGGVPIYHGAASGFEEWKFKVTSKFRALSFLAEDIRESRKREFGPRVVEGLGGDGLKVAMDVGMAALNQKLALPG